VNPLVARLGSWEELGEGARAVRFTVFVGEQGIPPEVEIDDMDAHHVRVAQAFEEVVAVDGLSDEFARARQAAPGKVGDPRPG